MSFDFIAAIKNIAPMVAGTFGTPLLGMAVSAICGALPADQAKAVQDAHVADPAGGALQKISELFQQGVINTAQIKQAELAHAERMAELGYKSLEDLEKIAAGDRDSARKREESVHDRMPAYLAAASIAAALLVTYLIFAGNANVIAVLKDPATAAIAGGIIVKIYDELKQVYNYYLGSTAGSRSKDSTIADIAKS